MSTATCTDRDTIRALAEKVRDLAGSERNQANKAKAFALNNLTLDRPFVLCSPEGAWREIIPNDELVCSDPQLRSWERQLREKIFQAEHIRDDSVVEDFLDVWTPHSRGSWGVEIPEHRTDATGAANWDAPITDIQAQLPELTHRHLTIDRAKTARLMEEAEDLVGDLLVVREDLSAGWSIGLTQDIIKLIGLEGLLLGMYDNPDGIHQLMAWLRDDHAGLMDDLEGSGLLLSRSGANQVGSGGIGYVDGLPSSDPRDADFKRGCTFMERWGLAESQETVGVSPDMFAEFVLPYQMPLLERIGLPCYGCCEPLDTRIDHVLKIPRLRRLSVSPWADRQILADRLERNYVYSRKPNPAPVCLHFDEDTIRKELVDTLAIAGDCVIEFVLKDTHTIEHERDRFERWVAIAREEIDRHYGD